MSLKENSRQGYKSGNPGLIHRLHFECSYKRGWVLRVEVRESAKHFSEGGMYKVGRKSGKMRCSGNQVLKVTQGLGSEQLYLIVVEQDR